MLSVETEKLRTAVLTHKESRIKNFDLLVGFITIALANANIGQVQELLFEMIERDIVEPDEVINTFVC